MRQALATLLGVLPAGPQAQAEAPALTVRRGETLQAVLRRAAALTPYNEDFLRPLLLARNPQAFPPGARSPVAGAPVHLPEADALRAHLQARLGPGTGPRAAAGPEPAVPAAAQRGWVRYP